MLVRTISRVLLLAVALGAAAPAAFAGCTREQATQRMTAVVTALGQKAGQMKTAEETQKLQGGYAKLNEGGEAMAKADFDKACQIYDGIAKDLDLKL